MDQIPNTRDSKWMDKLERFFNFDAVWARQACRIALSGRKAVMVNWSQKRHRLMQRLMISTRQTKADYLVIGSSRQGYHDPLMPYGEGVNLWINSAMLGDRLFTYELFRQRNEIPRTVIVGVDPWMFDPAAARERMFQRYSLPVFSKEYGEVIQEYSEMPKEDFHHNWGLPLPVDRKNDAAIPSESIMFEILEKAKLIPFPITENAHPVCTVLHSDGTFEHSERTLRHSRDSCDLVWEEAARFGAEYGWYMLKTYQTPDVFLWKLFQIFLRRIKGQTETLIVHIPPFHPAAYNSYKFVSRRMEKPLLQYLENDIREFTYANDMKMVGSFDPELIGGGGI